MKKIKWALQYLLYFFLTQRERHQYSMGKIKGMNCIGYSTGAIGRTYQYDPSKEPTRDYLTWKEFIENKNKES